MSGHENPGELGEGFHALSLDVVSAGTVSVASRPYAGDVGRHVFEGDEVFRGMVGSNAALVVAECVMSAQCRLFSTAQ